MERDGDYYAPTPSTMSVHLNTEQTEKSKVKKSRKPALITWRKTSLSIDGYVSGNSNKAFIIEKASDCVYLHCYDKNNQDTKYTFKDVREAKLMARRRCLGKDISSTVVGIIEKMTTEDNFSENISAAEALLARIRKLK